MQVFHNHRRSLMCPSLAVTQLFGLPLVAIIFTCLCCTATITTTLAASTAVTTASENSMPTSSITGCSSSSDANCLKCNIEGCVKCPMLLQVNTRRCIDVCPSGYVEQWSTSPDFMGRICQPTSISGPILAAIVGITAGFLVCVALIIGAFVLVRKKRRRKHIKEKLINETNIDRADFLRQLDDIRPEAEYILAMLNDTRRQIRKLYLSGETASANSYRPIIRDLAKLLILLNRPIELIPSPPPDWNRLYTWAERALERYKPQVGQLIDFLQAPPDPRLDPFKNSTFRSKNNGLTTTDALSSSLPNQQQLQLFGSLISLHEFEEPHPSDPFNSNSYSNNKGNLISTDLHASSLWLEDEFFKLGFRPQDEITTEL